MGASLNHHMFSEVDHWFYRHLAGIQLGDELVIKPCFISGIDWVKAKHKEIEVEWNREMIKITTPVNAKLILWHQEMMLEKGTYQIPIKHGA